MNIVEIIKHANLDENEKLIIDLLYEYVKNGNSKITIRDLSKLTYSSPSSIVRLAKKIGFYGYSDMLFSFRKQLASNVKFEFTDSLSSVIISEDSLHVLDQLIVDIASRKYHRIHVYGLGYSNYVCNYFRDKLVEMDYFATCSNPIDVINNESCLVLFVSNSGETSDLVKIAKECIKNNFKMYTISSQQSSKLCKIAQNNIIISQENEHNLNQTCKYFTGNAIILLEKISSTINNLNNLEEKKC